ncbi:MAG: hypothetical protein ABI635_11290 [Actinomycetota bacterium]
MRSIARVALPALLVTGLTIMTAGPAWAAAPTNDDFANATVVTVSPFTDGPVSTAEATTQTTDPVVCAGAAHSVWYRYTADHSGSVSFDTFGSTFDTALSAYTGTEGALSLVACNDDAPNMLQSQITFDISAGTTYSIMAVGCCDTAAGASGDLVVNAQASAAPFTFDVSFTSGSVDLKTHTVTVNGAVVCSEPGVVDLAGQLQQRGALGSLSAEVACSANRTTFTAAVSSSVGSFMPGRATVRDVAATGCGTLDCDVISLGGEVATIRLSP